MSCTCARPTFITPEWDEDEVPIVTVNWLNESLRFCPVCGSCDDFDDMEPCDGNGCTLEPPQLCHARCMTRVQHHAYLEDDGANLCPFCVASKREPFEEC